MSCNRSVGPALKSRFVQTMVANGTFSLCDTFATIADVLYGRSYGLEEPFELLRYHGLNTECMCASILSC
jgi:hypothetical protein